MIKVNHALYVAAQRELAGGKWRVDEKRGILHREADRLAGQLNSSGYLRLRFSIEGRGVGALAHRVMWEALRGPIPDGLYINHLDGVKTNNAIANLELVTLAGNMQHALRTGLMDGNWRMKPALTRERVREIFIAAWTGGETGAATAARFDVKASRLNGIKYRHHCPQFTADLVHLMCDQRVGQHPQSRVDLIRERVAAGETSAAIARDLKMPARTVRAYASGERRGAA